MGTFTLVGKSIFMGLPHLVYKGKQWLRGLSWRVCQDTLSAAQQFLNDLRDPAEFIGEWMFYAAALLITLALIKHFPYRLFAKTHKLLAVAYLALVFHTIVLLNFAAWTKPLGIIMGLLLLAGVVSAVLILTNQVGKKRRVEGTIEAQHYFPEMKVLETSILLKDGWKGHKSGQFAFVTFDSKEGQHPFTIASAWDANDPKITFITKGLGDYTDYLPEKLQTGDKVTVEGPYGCFTFDDIPKAYEISDLLNYVRLPPPQ